MNTKDFEYMRSVGLKLVDEARAAGDIEEVERLETELAKHKEIFDTAKAKYRATGYSEHFYWSFREECRGCGKYSDSTTIISGSGPDHGYYGNICSSCRPPAVKPIQPPAHWKTEETRHETI